MKRAQVRTVMPRIERRDRAHKQKGYEDTHQGPRQVAQPVADYAFRAAPGRSHQPDGNKDQKCSDGPAQDPHVVGSGNWKGYGRIPVRPIEIWLYPDGCQTDDTSCGGYSGSNPDPIQNWQL